MNKLIKKIVNGNSVIFILQTENETDYWYWEVDKTYVDNYKGTDEEFVNDYEYSSLGYSCSSFKTFEDAIADAER